MSLVDIFSMVLVNPSSIDYLQPFHLQRNFLEIIVFFETKQMIIYICTSEILNTIFIVFVLAGRGY